MPKLYLYHSFFGWKLSELTIVNHKGSASTSDVTLTLPAQTDTLATSGDVTALAIALG